MKTEITKSKVLYSMAWKLMERGGAQLVQAVVQILLARFLMPEEYGLIVLVSTFIVVANVFLESGLNIALIQKKNVDEVDFSSVFYLNLSISILLYILLYVAAPYIADFYNDQRIVSVARVLSLTLFIGGFSLCQGAYLSRNMMFKELFKSTLLGTVVAGAIGVLAAYMGLGVWALVLNSLIKQLIVAIIIWFTVKWRPKLVFSVDKIKTLFSYSSKIMASNIIYTFYENIINLIIVRAYSSAMLGFYNRGNNLPKLIMTNINESIQAVMLPTLSHYQDDIVKVKNMLKRTILTSTFVIFPMMAGLAAVGEPVIRILLTEKWMKAVPFLQIFCLYYALWPIMTPKLQVIMALGRSDIILKREIVSTTIGIMILLVSVPRGVYAIAFGLVISSLIDILIVSRLVFKLTGYGHAEQTKDILPSLMASVAMGAVVYSLNFLDISDWQKLILQFSMGVAIYIGIARMFRIESLSYLIATIKQLRENRA